MTASGDGRIVEVLAAGIEEEFATGNTYRKSAQNLLGRLHQFGYVIMPLDSANDVVSQLLDDHRAGRCTPLEPDQWNAARMALFAYHEETKRYLSGYGREAQHDPCCKAEAARRERRREEHEALQERKASIEAALERLGIEL